MVSKIGIAIASAGALLAAKALASRLSTYSLKDKTVLITGGSRGLGLVMAREFAARKASIAICARDEAELERARLDLEQRGARVIAIRCDVTDEEEVNSMIETVGRYFGRIDILVNNAGVIQMGPFEEMTRTDFEQTMSVHFWAPLNTTLAALPWMRRQGEGRIINIASVGGKVSVPHLLPYCASKYALVGFSEGLRAALMKDGVYVTTVCPGLMRTGSPRNADFKGQHRREYTLFSISDALPLITVSAENAARQIVDACQRGQAELIISLPAKLAILANTLFPGLTQNAFGLVNELLPGPGGIGKNTAKGKESYTFLSPSLLTSLNERAAAQNNELG